VGGDIENRGAALVVGNWHGPTVRLQPSALRELASNGIGTVYRLNIAWGINNPFLF
jgi:hypothetical protein